MRLQTEFQVSNLSRPVARMVAMLCVLLSICPLPAGAWQAGSPAMEMVVLQGDGATHVVNSSHFEEPVVEVRLDGRPVRGAIVIFEAPDSGPGGQFRRNGQTVKRISFTTGKNGRAKGKGFQSTNEVGEWRLKVTAVKGEQRAVAELRQTNVFSESVAQQTQKSHRRQFLWVMVGVTTAIVLLAWYASLDS